MLISQSYAARTGVHRKWETADEATLAKAYRLEDLEATHGKTKKAVPRVNITKNGTD